MRVPHVRAHSALLFLISSALGRRGVRCHLLDTRQRYQIQQLLLHYKVVCKEIWGI